MIKIIFLSMVFFYSLNGEGFIKKINIVVDEEKNIMWQDNTESINHKENFTMAKVYCETLILNGYIDWRVPTIKELLSLIDVKNKKAAIIKEFEYTQSDIYYSSTKSIQQKNNYWFVDFASGVINTIDKKEKIYIRCVRDIK